MSLYRVCRVTYAEAVSALDAVEKTRGMPHTETHAIPLHGEPLGETYHEEEHLPPPSSP